MSTRRKKFLSYYRPYAGKFLLVLLCSLISAGAAVLFPLCVRNITQAILEGGAFSVREPLLLLLLVTLVEVCSSAFYDYTGHSIGANMENDLRQELFSHLENLSFSFYDTHRVGELMSHLTNDLSSLAEFFHHAPEDYLVYSVKFIGSAVILFFIDPTLTLYAFALLPVMLFLTLYLNRKVRRASAQSLDNISKINSRAEEALSGIRVSQAFNRQDYERRSFAEAGLRFIRSRRAIYGAEAVEYQSLTLLTRLMYVIAILAGLYRIHFDYISVADLIAFILYIENLTTPVKQLAWMTTQYQQGMAGFDRAMNLLDIPQGIADLPDALPLPDVRGDIAFENVTFGYRQDTPPVLKNISFTLPAGHCIAIVGISGVGKSTLCGLIPRFYEPQQGAILLDGRDIRTVSLSDLRAQISVVQQDTYLFSGSVMENIRYSCPKATDDMVRDAARSAGAEEFIVKLPQGYRTDIGPRGVRLSGGQRQRLSIARAFLRDAPLLILDEATSALDNESEQAIRLALDRLRQGRTTLLIAHRLSTVRSADIICVLRKGTVCEMGTYEELLHSDGEFSRLYAE